jgi:opacity protein-like surface antigen
MVRSTVSLAAALAAITLAANAYAQDAGSQASNDKALTTSDGWYFSGSAGLSFLEEQNNRNRSGSVNFDTSGANPGFDVTGALGKDLGNGFRAEGELGYRQIELGHGTVYSPGGTGIATGYATGNSHAVSLMGNGYYDFKFGSPIVPYVGVGIGMADVSMDGVSINGSPAVSDSDLAFAYQAMVGIGYQITPTGTIYTGYRYFATAEPNLSDAAGDRFHSDFESHNLEIGYRLAF